MILATIILAMLYGCGQKRNNVGAYNDVEAYNEAVATVVGGNNARVAAAAPNSATINDHGSPVSEDQELANTQAMSLLIQQNVQCIDQIVTSEPQGKSRQQIIDDATRGCLSIAVQQARLTPGVDPEKSERDFVTDQVRDLAEIARGTNSPP